jgi:hypothetical protein
MNDLDANLQRLAAEATRDSTTPDVQVIMRRGRRRRVLSRPVLAGTVALVLVLAAAVALAAVRGRADRPPVGPAPTTPRPAAPTSTVVAADGWKTYTDAAHNLRLRYPPAWVVRRRHQEGMVTLAPPEQARWMLARWPPFAVTVSAGGGYYLGEAPEPGISWGRLPGGQGYLRFQSDPAQMVEAPGGPKPAPNVADRPRAVSYSIDWGRDCKGVRPYRCGPHGVHVTIYAGNGTLWDRYGAVAEAIVRSATPVAPTQPSHGDRRLPACRPDQWRVIWPGEHGFAGPQRFFLSGGIRYRGGPRCHLRARLELLVERDGRRLSLSGNPATRVVEGDLPEDGITKDSGSWVMRGGPLFWSFYWQEWCNKGLEGSMLRLSAANGQRLPIAGPDPRSNASPSPGFRGCEDRSQPSRLAPWP